MLTPDSIPDKEPVINVGIVLPEDDYQNVVVQTPDAPSYTLFSGSDSIPLGSNQTLLFSLLENTLAIHMNGEMISAGDTAEIRCDSENPELHPGQGLIVENVIAGRGFHWKKYITVHLPGDIRIVKHGNSLILINLLPLEQYVMCVATSEMGAACPSTLIEAQTITARSWILANVEQKHRHLDMDVCNDDCCQRYQGSTYLSAQSVKGALNTFGQVLMHKNTICDARYSKSCGGMMERFETIWEGPGHDYLQSIPDADNALTEWIGLLQEEDTFRKWINSVPEAFCSSRTVPENSLKKYLGSVDEEGKYFRWTIQQTQESLTRVINTHLNVQASKIIDLKPVSRGGSGRINRLEIEYLDRSDKRCSATLESEFAIRQSLHEKFLYSSAFFVEKEPDVPHLPEIFIFHGAGWGHGVGLCQIGALGMAINEYPTAEIVEHYYPGSILKKIY